MSKFFKKAVCPKCGREQHGFYINPFCMCGHRLRDFNGWEKHCLGAEDDEFQSLSVFTKRDLLRQVEWNSCDVMWQGGFLAFVLIHYSLILFKFRDTLADDTGMIILAAVVGTIIGAELLRIVAKTIYFHWLKKKDILFFKQNGGA